MSEKSMHAVLDFGAEAVKNVDAKLAILRFDYSWVAEVEREERIMEEVEKQPLETTDVVRQLKSDEDKTIHRQLILDFGKEAVKNIDEKLDILKFNYNWVDEVEREERKAEKASKKPLEHTDTMKQKQWMSDEDYKTIYGQEFLDFGGEPVRSLDAKLDILKFSYSWATEVEDHERRMEEEVQVQTKEQQEDGTEKEIQKAVSKEDEKLMMPEKPQEVTSAEDKTNDKTEEIQDPLPKEEAQQEKTGNYLSKPPEFFNDEKLDTGLKREMLQIRQELNCAQQLTDQEVENEEHFIPRRLFLFGITEFKNDANQITTCTEMIPALNVPNPLNELSTTCISETTMTTVSSKKSLRRRIKNFKN